MSVFRQFALGRARAVRFRMEIFNVTNTPHFANPSANASNPANFGIITGTANSGREGIDERMIRLGIRFGF